MVSATEIVALQDRMTEDWHERTDASVDGSPPGPLAASGNERKARENWLRMVVRQHRANFDLWHIEDEARAPGASDAELAAVKRRVDRTNQLRNDLVEDLDQMLLDWLESRGLPNLAAPLNSEPPGMIIDRLSILALKIYHTREEAERAGSAGGSRDTQPRAPCYSRRAARMTWPAVLTRFGRRRYTEHGASSFIGN